MSHRISQIRISIASDKDVLDWSHGEVTSPETINYKTFIPEQSGLFCQRIFGPVKDYECACGKYKKSRFLGHTCEKCGVEVALSKVRRERFGHVKLNAPVAHIWFFKIAPSIMSLILDIKSKKIEEIIYFVSYVVLDPGTSDFKHKEVIDHERSRVRMIEVLANLHAQNVFSKEDLELYEEYMEILKNDYMLYSFQEISELVSKYTGAKFGVGAEAILALLKQIDLEEELKKNQEKLKNSSVETKRLIKRQSVLISFINGNNSLEDMIINNLPILPPEIRPIVALANGKVTTSDINDLCQRIIIRNIRYQKAKEMGAPTIVINNQLRMLQEAVDAYFDNSRRKNPTMSKNNRALSSLTDALKGKKGRLREHLLGKRVDYSARSVIVTNPELKLYECGLPQDIALILFKPFVIHYLIKHGYADNIKIAEKLIEKKHSCAWKALRHEVTKRPILLNRAPTLHRGSFQAFEIILTTSKKIEISSLEPTPFNADADGDLMAAHLPLSDAAVIEARALMIGSRNILSPKDGKPILTPTQDIILGLYYLTSQDPFLPEHEIKMFNSITELEKLLTLQTINVNELILYDVSATKIQKHLNAPANTFIITTPGKIIFNDIFPEELPFINGTRNNVMDYDLSLDLIHLSKHKNKSSSQNNFTAGSREEIHAYLQNFKPATALKKTDIANLITILYERFPKDTARLLDRIKDNGFKYATESGISISYGDIKMRSLDRELNDDEDIKKYTQEQIAAADIKINYINDHFQQGFITDEERSSLVINIWTSVKKDIQKFIDRLIVEPSFINNPVCIMSNSGARGSSATITQLSAMRGLMTSSKGKIIELPIKSSLSDGLSVLEFFISIHGARKGMTDTAFKTADSGYLTRRLIFATHDTIISEDDCKTTKGFEIKAIYEEETNFLVVPLYDRIVGRYTAANVVGPNNKILCKKRTLITPKIAHEIVAAGVESVFIHSVLTCEAKTGVCVACYGYDLTVNRLVKKHTPVGIIAAQSLGEPGTQLTMNTFHSGGEASAVDITQGLPRIIEIFDVVKPKGSNAIIAPFAGEVVDVEEHDNIHELHLKRNYYDKNQSHDEIVKITTNYNDKINVKKGDRIVAGQQLTAGSIDLSELLTYGGFIKTQEYIFNQVHKIFRMQGISISDKHIEVIIRKMLENVVLISKGDSDLVEGRLVYWRKLNEINKQLIAKKQIPAYGAPIILGLKKSSIENNSFLSAASFQDTPTVLVNAAVYNKVDNMLGLKENILVGNKIPAGTNFCTDAEMQELKETYKDEKY